MPNKPFKFDLDDLPLMLRESQICSTPKRKGLLPISRSTWRDLQEEGYVPPPVRLGPKIIAWPRSVVLNLIENGTGDRRVRGRQAKARAKAHAKELKIDPSKVALGGASSGGHLAMLSAMRPNDARYSSIPGPAGVDASVKAVVMLWPVINPISRYNNAIRRSAEPNPPAFTVGMKDKHDTYWQSEANMREGNPMLILERGEKVVMPPAIWVQGRPDEVHDYHDPEGGFAGNEPERFVSNYRKAGGDIEITYFDNAKVDADVSHAPVLDFLKKHL